MVRVRHSDEMIADDDRMMMGGWTSLDADCPDSGHLTAGGHL